MVEVRELQVANRQIQADGKIQVLGLGAHEHGPVSYTHLDVYKRQQAKGEDRMKPLQEFVESKGGEFLFNTCLLYTSRCV